MSAICRLKIARSTSGAPLMYFVLLSPTERGGVVSRKAADAAISLLLSQKSTARYQRTRSCVGSCVHRWSRKKAAVRALHVPCFMGSVSALLTSRTYFSYVLSFLAGRLQSSSKYFLRRFFRRREDGGSCPPRTFGSRRICLDTTQTPHVVDVRQSGVVFSCDHLVRQSTASDLAT